MVTFSITRHNNNRLFLVLVSKFKNPWHADAPCLQKVVFFFSLLYSGIYYTTENKCNFIFFNVNFNAFVCLSIRLIVSSVMCSFLGVLSREPRLHGIDAEDDEQFIQL